MKISAKRPIASWINPDKFGLTQIVFKLNNRWQWWSRAIKTGSRYRGGNVPNVNFNEFNGKVNVNRYNPGHADGDLRPREVVSKEAPNRSFLVEDI